MRSKLLSVLLISIILAVGIFGFLGLDHFGRHACPISMIAGGGCLFIEDTLALITHHVSGLRQLTQSLVVLTLLAFALLLFLKISQNSLLPRLVFYRKNNEVENSRFVSRAKLLRWLSFSYKAYPSALDGRVV
ncbi:MAG: hypothetical protein HYT03_00920 [Candidatus Harrisonbacteria bacterium]|nr:hypothetical protein [Candidatus Harrisonbacteria bacterium]